MMILAIDSSSIVASVALYDGHRILGEFSLECGLTHSQTLMPLIEQLMIMTHTDIDTVELIATTEGPGSFTGLRIGAATVKGLALRRQIPVMNINTIEALAYNIEPTDYLICPIMDAKRQEVYTGLYQYTNGSIETLVEPQPLPVSELIPLILSYERKVLFLGDGVPVHQEAIKRHIHLASFASEAHRTQRAGAVAVAAVHRLKHRQPLSGDAFRPIYLRKSQAERELSER